MNKLLIGLLAIWLGFGSALAANVNIDGLPAASSVGSTDLIECEQSGTNNKCTQAQVKTFIGGAQTVTGSCGVTASPTSGAVVISSNITARNTTATTDTITNADCGTVVTESNASSVAVAITTTGFVSGNYFTAKNLGVGVATYTPSSGTINGAASLACNNGQSFDGYFDGTNFQTLSNTCGATATIASGTAALGTSLIASGACGSATTVSAAGVATTDTIIPSFNGDPTAVTGYLPTAMLTVVPYPTSGNVNFKQCNLTGSGITPSALTLNWRVVR